MKCRRCGADNAAYMRICGHCGLSISSLDSGLEMDENMPQPSDYLADRASPAIAENHEVDGSAVNSITLNGLMHEGLIDRIGFLRSKRSGLKSLVAMAMVTYGGWLVLCLLALICGISTVYPELETWSFDLHVFFTGSLVTLSGGSLQGWYIFLICAIIVSAVWVTKKSWHKFLGELMEEGAAKDHSHFFEICGLLFALRFITKTIVYIMKVSGTSPVNPFESAEDWEMLFLLADASVWEELAFRVLLIGLPLIAVDLAMTRCRKQWRYLTGGEIGIGKAEVLLITFSAAMFAFAHVEGWGSWRVLDTGLAGVALGYVFLKYGLAASIVLHFSIDYMVAPLLVFHDGGVVLLMTFGNIIWLSLGLILAVYYAIRLVEYVSGTIAPRTDEMTLES